MVVPGCQKFCFVAILTVCLACLNKLPKFQNRIKCPTCRDLMPPNQSFPTNYIALKLTTGEAENKSREIMCQHHPDYKADHFCLLDKQRVCLYCKVYGDHRDHDLVHVEELKLNLEKSIADTQKDLGKFQNSFTEFSDFYQGIKRKLIQSSESKYDQLIDFLQYLKSEATKKIGKTFNRALENMKSHETYQRPLKGLEVFEKEVAELRRKSPDEFVTSAFTFIAQISERFPGGDCTELKQNQKKSDDFLNQILNTLDEQTQKIISILTKNFEEFKDFLSEFNLCCREHVKPTTSFFINTIETNPFKIKVKLSDTFEDLRQRLVAEGICRPGALFDYQDNALQMGISISDCNLPKNSLITVKYPKPNPVSQGFSIPLLYE